MDKVEKISAAQKTLGDFALKLLGYTDNVLISDLWEGKELLRYERKLNTIAALLGSEHSRQLKFRLHFASWTNSYDFENDSKRDVLKGKIKSY